MKTSPRFRCAFWLLIALEAFLLVLEAYLGFPGRLALAAEGRFGQCGKRSVQITSHFFGATVPTGTAHIRLSSSVAWFSSQGYGAGLTIVDGQGNLLGNPQAEPLFDRNADAGGTEWEYVLSGLQEGQTYRLSPWAKWYDLCGAEGTPITIRVSNTPQPTAERAIPQDKARCPCPNDCQETGSTTSPFSGDQSFTVEAGGWNSHGATYPFSLSYHSAGYVDAASPLADLDGLETRGERWSHPYAQWIDLYRDEAGTVYAFWHHDGSYTVFTRVGTQFTAEDSTASLAYGGGPVTSPSFPWQGGTTTLQTPYAWFKVTDEEGTEYRFNSGVPAGQTHLAWRTGEGKALPHYLLSSIQDRYARINGVTASLTLTWSGGAQPRVTAVQDSDGRGLTLAYTNGLLQTVSAPQGVILNVGYTSVPDENGILRQRPDEATVYGPGSPNRTVYHWSFRYRDPLDPGKGYGGTDSYTGDLVIRKTEPDGKTTWYEYDRQILVPDPSNPAVKLRVSYTNWAGRIQRISWLDESEGATVEKAITRGVSTTPPGQPSQPHRTPEWATLTYPGGAATRFFYTGGLLTAQTDLSTGQSVAWAYDSRHNPTSFRTARELDTPRNRG